MARKVRTILNRALYLSVADREFSPIEPDGDQINVAINLFIDILDQFGEQIPFNNEVTLNGETELQNVNAETINYVNYILSPGNVTVPLQALTQLEFSRINRVLNLRAIPVYYWHDEGNNAIQVYPLPQKTTDQFIVGLRPIFEASRIDDVFLGNLTGGAVKFLIYQLASDLCDEYNIPWSAKKQASLDKAYQDMLDNSQYKPAQPFKPRLKDEAPPVPWLAYLSGNIPGV